MFKQKVEGTGWNLKPSRYIVATKAAPSIIFALGG
jgi:hypothetical protein